MKKQHFLLILILAFFAGISSGYAQCTGAPLTPAAGVEYTYSATIGDLPAYDGTHTPIWDWYVTKNVNILTGIIPLIPPTMFTVNGTTPYHDPSTGVNNIKITWTQAAIADGGPFYLVLRYRENNNTTSPTCSAENIRIWNIVPVNTFLLAMEGGMLSGGIYVPTANSFTCAADVTGAIVTPGPPPTALLTYGNNTLNFVATASGILGDWRPDISVPILQNSQVYVSAQWSANMNGSGPWVDFPIAGTGAAQQLQSPSNATVTDVNGTPILIRIVINNGNWRTLADQPITVGLDGYLPTAYSVSDIQGSGATPCDPEPAFGRTGIYTIKARPTVTGNPVTITLTNP
jgi:hypothetical protein